MRNVYPVLQIVLRILALAVFSIPLAAQSKEELTSIDNSNGRYYVETWNGIADARIAEFLGRPSLWLKNNTQVLLAGSEFVNGTIEFDVSPTEKGHFFAVMFRRETFQNHENIYFRAHKSGEYNAMQYAPRINGSSTWQLYPEFNTKIDFPRNQWTHVRIEVEGTRLAVYLNDGAAPSLVVQRLRHGSQHGPVGFWARVNDQPATWAAAVSNVSVRNASAKPETTTPFAPTVKSQTTTKWEVAGPVQTQASRISILPEIKDWQKVDLEESGLINFNRAFGFKRGRWAAFARTTVNSDRERIVLLELGYSDDVTVFLNGVGVYCGINGFESRHPEYMGFVLPGFENIPIKLKHGSNELLFAVVDDQRFGWGLIARVLE